MAMLLNVKRTCTDMEKIDMQFATFSTTELQTIDINIVQTEGDCAARIVIEPMPHTKSKVTINIFAEGTAKVNCVCNLVIPKDVDGVETDIQLRSWPFERAKISARPEMFIANSNVIARHGNALGSLSKEQQYYLSTRGITNYKDAVKYSLLENA